MGRIAASLLGGLFIGILSALPVVQAANCCCLLWVIVGGALTAYLLQQGRPAPVAVADAALSGLLAGLIGAAISVGFSVLLFSVSGDMIETQIRDIVDQYPQMPPDLRDRLLTVTAGPNFVLLLSLVTVPLYAVAGMFGALLGRAIFRKPSPPAAQA